MSEMTRERVAAIRKSRAAAERELLRLCKNMELPRFSIPARPDADTDLIFRKALDDSRDLCTALQQAWEREEKARKAVAAFAFGRDYMLDPFCTPEWQRVIEVLELQNG